MAGIEVTATVTIVESSCATSAAAAIIGLSKPRNGQIGEARMHTVQTMEHLKELAQQAGYVVRHEWLGGVAGGACEFAGRKWIFVDLSLSVVEQLEQLAEALRRDPTALRIDSAAPQTFANRSRLKAA